MIFIVFSYLYQGFKVQEDGEYICDIVDSFDVSCKRRMYVEDSCRRD
jgi:hypothetical protein